MSQWGRVMVIKRKKLNADHRKQRGRIAPNSIHRIYKNPMLIWAEREVRRACEKENPNWDGETFDYGIACLQSALKAYKVLLKAEHSGFSWELTKSILLRLINNEPLTPITDEDFISTNNNILESEEYLQEHNLKSSIQCPRMSSLFRSEYLDGTITYTDVDRYYCYDINNTEDIYAGGGAANILDEYCPITMPYYPPTEKYQICCETFQYDSDMDDCDTKAYWKIYTPTQDVILVNKFYKNIKDGERITDTFMSASYITEDGTIVEGREHTYSYQPTKWVEITQEEFEERKKHKIDENSN